MFYWTNRQPPEAGGKGQRIIMQAPKRLILTSLALSLAFLAGGFSAPDAEAQLYSRNELRCRKGIAVAARRYFERTNKARQQCFARILQGDQKPDVDCITDVGDPKLDARLLKVKALLGRLLPRQCVGVNLVLLDFPGICNDDNADPFTISDLEECVIEKTDAAISALYGMYYPQVVEFAREEDRRCILGVSDRAAAALRQERRRREDCLLRQERGRVSDEIDCRAPILQFGGGTGSSKIDSSIRNAINTLFGQIPLVCANTTLADLGYDEVCPDPEGPPFSNADLIECLYTKNAASASALLDVAFPQEPVCGNGRVEADEECDEGVDNNSDTDPDTCRSDCTNPVCGDTVVDPGNGETCDDGNTADLDGCTSVCTFEFCGDGTINNDGLEECDDGEANADQPDACRTDCVLPTCSDGITDPGNNEECDDANATSEDGCSADCVVEFCGDEIVQGGLGEECDNGDTNSDELADACRTNCVNAFCGDGVVDPGNNEACDDGNDNNADGCTNNCTICGDGNLDLGEECDDGDDNSDEMPDACRTDCTNPSCGDGVVDPGNLESCDDGNLSDNDMCPTTCELATCGDGFLCTEVGCNVGPAGGAEACDEGAGNSDTAPDACRTDCSNPGCGDGVTDSTEECDGASRGACLSNEACLDSCECKHLCPGSSEMALFAGTGPECETDDDCIAGTCDAGLGRCRTTTELDSGWTGISHDADINDLTVTRNLLECDATGPVCGVCEVKGLDPSSGNCRCSADNQTLCSETFGADPVCNFGACTSRVCSGDGVTPCTSQAACSGNGTCVGTCSGNTNVVCTNDATCQDATCNCYLGAPFPLSAGGTPACVVNRFAEDVTGTTNVDSGDSAITANLRTQVFLGISTVNPCPTCGGVCQGAPGTTCTFDDECGSGVCLVDGIVNDGVRGGVCLNGEDAGKSCDVNALNTSFPARSAAAGGSGYSLDCFPDIGKNVSGSGLRIMLTQTTGQSSLDANVACGTNPAIVCPCKQCSADTSVPCNRNADCADQQGSCSVVTSAACTSNGDCTTANAGTCNQGIGRCSGAFSLRCTLDSDCQGVDGGVCNASTCSSVGGGLSVQPNQCSDGACIDQGGGEGACNVSPNDRTCDAVVRPNGEGILGCGSNADCAASVIGIAGGNCTLSKRRECFLDPIVAEGVADPDFPIAAAVFCIPPTASSGINGVAGLPGPGRVVNQQQSILFCAEDPDSTYTPGVGGCPQ